MFLLAGCIYLPTRPDPTRPGWPDVRTETGVSTRVMSGWLDRVSASA